MLKEDGANGDREELHDFKDKVLCMLTNIRKNITKLIIFINLQPPKHFIIILYTMH
jgi:hypothetical protein